jgi:hypothetical protein
MGFTLIGWQSVSPTKDVAKRAGIAVSKVSYALSRAPSVTEETRPRTIALLHPTLSMSSLED